MCMGVAIHWECAQPIYLMWNFLGVLLEALETQWRPRPIRPLLGWRICFGCGRTSTAIPITRWMWKRKRNQGMWYMTFCKILGDCVFKEVLALELWLDGKSQYWLFPPWQWFTHVRWLALPDNTHFWFLPPGDASPSVPLSLQTQVSLLQGEGLLTQNNSLLYCAPVLMLDKQAVLYSLRYPLVSHIAWDLLLIHFCSVDYCTVLGTQQALDKYLCSWLECKNHSRNDCLVCQEACIMHCVYRAAFVYRQCLECQPP